MFWWRRGFSSRWHCVATSSSQRAAARNARTGNKHQARTPVRPAHRLPLPLTPGIANRTRVRAQTNLPTLGSQRIAECPPLALRAYRRIPSHPRPGKSSLRKITGHATGSGSPSDSGKGLVCGMASQSHHQQMTAPRPALAPTAAPAPTQRRTSGQSINWEPADTPSAIAPVETASNSPRQPAAHQWWHRSRRQRPARPMRTPDRETPGSAGQPQT
jgi:hypothetical protein